MQTILKNNIIYPFLDILFPQKCILCNNIIKTSIPSFPLCISCNKTINFKPDKIISNNITIYSLGKYNDKLKDIIHNFKYKKISCLGKYFAEKMYFYFNKDLISTIDLIIPAPIHKNRLFQRGFNQSEKTASHLSNLSKIKLNTKLLYKKTDTISQTKLNRKERLTNIQNSFILKKNKNIKIPKHILLIDDIRSTGSTTNECIKTLKYLNKDINFSIMLIAINQ
jgi:competence protein ComFC